jgi:hypothetical protein
MVVHGAPPAMLLSRRRLWGSIVAGAVLAGELAFAACGGTTGREDAPAPAATETPDATLGGGDPFRLEGGSTFDVVIQYADQMLPDIQAPDTGSANGGDGAGPVPTGCAPNIPYDDAGNVMILPTDAGIGYLLPVALSDAGQLYFVPTVASWGAAEYDGGVAVPASPTSICTAERLVVDQYNPNLPITPTEQQFLNKDVSNGDSIWDAGLSDGVQSGFSCTNCLMLNDCVHAQDNERLGLFSPPGVPTLPSECEDLTGLIAAAGLQQGVSKVTLCENVLTCILQSSPNCVFAATSSASGTQGCYCGTVQQSACGKIDEGMGACAQAEADGLELPINQPSTILKTWATLGGAGIQPLAAAVVNQTLSCAFTNDCLTCFQGPDAGAFQ